MKQNEKTEVKATVSIQVLTQSYNQKGELTDVLTSVAKLTKADAGRSAAYNYDALTFKSSTNGCSKMEMSHNSTVAGEGTLSKSLETDLSAKRLNAETGTFVGVFSAAAKIADDEKECLPDQKTETYFNLTVEGDCLQDTAKTDSLYSAKTSTVSAFEQ